jgi:hypothetical protein
MRFAQPCASEDLLGSLMNDDTKLIAHYMAGCIRAKDNRGRHQNQLALYRALLPRTTPTIAMMTAQATRRVAEAICRVR